MSLIRQNVFIKTHYYCCTYSPSHYFLIFIHRYPDYSSSARSRENVGYNVANVSLFCQKINQPYAPLHSNTTRTAIPIIGRVIYGVHYTYLTKKTKSTVRGRVGSTLDPLFLRPLPRDYPNNVCAASSIPTVVYLLFLGFATHTAAGLFVVLLQREKTPQRALNSQQSGGAIDLFFFSTRLLFFFMARTGKRVARVPSNGFFGEDLVESSLIP